MTFSLFVLLFLLGAFALAVFFAVKGIRQHDRGKAIAPLAVFAVPAAACLYALLWGVTSM